MIKKVSEIKALHQGYFFSKDAMKFFKSKIYPTVYGGKYFVTSEQSPHGPRKFSVREWREDIDDIKTIGDFGGFLYLEDARDFAKTMAKSDMPIGRNPAGGMPIKFRLYTYDVWGNEEDGYDVNDVFQTNEIYTLNSDMTDAEIIESLQGQGGIPKGVNMDLIEIGGDFDSGLTFDYDGRPEFELRPE